MTQIKKVKTSEGAQFYPQTHTKAVVDDNGYTAESRLGAMQDEINQAQLAVGAVPSDLTPTEDSTNWVTSGGVYNALQEMLGTANTLSDEVKNDEKVIAAALVELASKVDDGYTFKGLVTPTDGVGTQIQKAAYVGMAGIYTNFSGNTFTVPSEHIGIFLWDGTSWSLSTKSIYLEDSVTITDFSDWTFGYLDGNGTINTSTQIKYTHIKITSGQTITVKTCGSRIVIAQDNNKALVTGNKANNVLGTYSYTPSETCYLYVAVRVANNPNEGTIIPPSITISSIVPPYIKKKNVVPFGEGEEYNDVVSALSLKNKSIITEEDAKWINGWMARKYPTSGNASMFLFENDSYSYIYAKVKGYNQSTYWAMAFYSDSPSDDTLIKSFTFGSLPYINDWYIIKEEIPENCKYIYIHAGGVGLANVTSKVRIFRKDSYLSLQDLFDNFQLVKDTTVFDGMNFVPSMYDNYGRYIQIRNHIGKKKNAWNATATNSDFRCIFMSDIHAQESTFRRIVGLTNLWHEEGYVDALINSGDVAYDLPTESYAWYNNLRNECAVDVLTTPGNHDYIYSNKGSKELCYSNIISPMVDGTTINSGEENETVVGQISGIVQPEDAADEHRFYYYKDYNSVRVIAIYMKVDATEQLTWLKEVLTDAVTNSKHVIIINHAPFAPALALREYATAAEFFENNPNTFYSSTSIVPGYASSGFTNSDTPISAAYVAAVKEFEDAGGNFICWLSGHCHSDAFYDVANHETYGYQLHLNTTCASNTMGSFDSIRVGSYGNRDSFNYLCVDTTKKVVEVLRIGNNTDIIGRSKIYFAYHYGLHKLIANY